VTVGAHLIDGDGAVTAAGKRTQVQAQGTPAPSASPPGKSTQIGATYGSGGDLVSREEMDNKILLAQLRGLVYAGLVGDVADATSAFNAAAAALAVKIKLEPHEISLLLSVCLSLAGGIAGIAVAHAIEHVQEGAKALVELPEVLAVTSDLPIPKRSSAIEWIAKQVASVPQPPLDLIVDQSIDVGKEAIKSAIGDGGGKDAQLIWLDAMTEAVPAQMKVFRDDAMTLPLPDLVVLRLAFDAKAKEHTVGAYREALERGLHQVTAVAQIGWRGERRRFVARVKVPSELADGPDVGTESRLALMDEDGDGKRFVAWLDDPALGDAAKERSVSTASGVDEIAADSFEAFEQSYDEGDRS
jgi:hypothetical protein